MWQIKSKNIILAQNIKNTSLENLYQFKELEGLKLSKKKKAEKAT